MADDVVKKYSLINKEVQLTDLHSFIDKNKDKNNEVIRKKTNTLII